jgi:hypothetical protein
MLSEKQFGILFKKMPKYARQLHGIAQAKQAQDAEIAMEIEQAQAEDWEPTEEQKHAAYQSGRMGSSFNWNTHPVLVECYMCGQDDLNYDEDYGEF